MQPSLHAVVARERIRQRWPERAAASKDAPRQRVEVGADVSGDIPRIHLQDVRRARADWTPASFESHRETSRRMAREEIRRRRVLAKQEIVVGVPITREQWIIRQRRPRNRGAAWPPADDQASEVDRSQPAEP